MRLPLILLMSLSLLVLVFLLLVMVLLLLLVVFLLLCFGCWILPCDDLRCDMGSCRKSNIYSPRYEGVRLIGSESNDVLQSGSDGKCL
jgi:hypothetical protein